jgi:hypothetical protein
VQTALRRQMPPSQGSTDFRNLIPFFGLSLPFFAF